MPGADDWRDIPDAVLEQDQRQTAAQEWGASARAELATQWGDNARSELNMLVPDAGQTYSEQNAGAGAGAFPTSPIAPPVSSSAGNLQPVAPAPAPSLSGLDDVQPGLPPNPTTRRPINDVSQFGDPTLTQAEAYAACGPAAAARLASIFGNNIPLRAVLDAAKQVGWTEAGGMNGISNEKRLLDKLNIPATVDYAPDPSKIIADARSGNPVTLSTPNHYFTIDDYDAQAGKYHVGKSGTAYRGGSEWMTMDQIRRIGGGVNGALFVDNPNSSVPGTAALETSQTQKYEGGPTAATPAQSPFDNAVQQAQTAVGGFGDQVATIAQIGNQHFQDALDQARQAVGYVPEEPTQPTPGFGLDPSHMQPATAPQEGVPLRQDVRDLGQPPQPTIFDQAGQGIGGAVNTLAQGTGEEVLARGAQERQTASQINEARSQYFPSILEPNHPFNVMADLEQKYGTWIPNDRMTPEDQQRARDVQLAIGGMVSPIHPAGGGASNEAANLMGQIAKYGPETRQGLEDFVRTQSQAGRSAQEIGDTVRQWIADNPPPVRHTTAGPVDTEPGGLMRSLGAIDESSGAAGPQRGQFALGLEGEPTNMPYGGPRPTGSEELPTGPQRGQFDLSGNPLPMGGPRPTGTEELAAGAQPGQARFPGDAPLYGETVRAPMDIAPIEARDIPAGAQPGQVRFPGDVPLYGETVRPPMDVAPIHAREIPAGEMPGQQTLPGVGDRPGTLSEKAIAIRYSSMLSSWYTHAQNIASNTGQMFTRPVRLAAAGYPGEAGGAVRGYLQGIPDGFAAFWDVMKNGARDVSKIEQGNPHPFGTGKVGQAVDFTTNLLQASDEFFKSIVYSGTIRSEATRLAKGDAATLQELLQSPTSGMVREAMQQARLATYTEDPGRIVNKILNLQRGLNPGERLAVNFIVPFVRTPSNILRRGVQFTVQPVTGPVKAVRALARGDTRTARLEAADTALASIVALAFAAKAAAGEMSGDGPTSAAERQQLMDQGWQPHSIKVGNNWVDYAWAGPLGIQMALIASTFEAVQNGKQGAPTDQQALDIANRLKGVLLQQSFLRGIGDLFKNTQSGLAGQVASYLGSNIPMGGLIKDVAEATDPLKRQADEGLAGVPGRVAERVPVLRETVRPDQTSLGEPAQNPRYGGGVIRGSPAISDSTLQILQQHDVTIPAPPKTLDRGAGPIQLTPDEQDALNTQRGQLIRRFVDQRAADPKFQRLTPEAQSETLKSIISAQSEAAKDWTLRRIGPTELAKRERAVVAAR